VVYTSDPAITADGPADATVGLFSIRLEDATESDLAALPWPRPNGMRRREGPSLFGGGRMPPFGGGGHPGHWRLLARHRAGSVDAVVAAVRRRNLAVSGGVLALLLASAVLIVVSAQRARRLADRQVEFVAGVSHELRTPLAVICAAGDNLAAGVVTDPANAREYGRVVREEGRRLAEMVERVLDLAGTYSGHRKWRLEDVDVELVLAECFVSLEPFARERGLAIESGIGGPLPLVRAERSALRRAVTNLLQNAILHGGDGGFVGLRAELSGPEGQHHGRRPGPRHSRLRGAASLRALLSWRGSRVHPDARQRARLEPGEADRGRSRGRGRGHDGARAGQRLHDRPAVRREEP
jgi:signal transduction histidine kinase